MDERHEVKTAILKSKSMRLSYYIRNCSLTDRLDIQRLCAEERIEILTPICRACFRNRFTFILLLLCIVVSMFIFSRLLYSFILPPTLITSFLSYRIAKLKHHIKAPFQHPFVEYTEKLQARRILVAIRTVEEEKDVIHEQDLLGFICFSSHPSERQSALITHLYVTKNFRREKIAHQLLQTCRRVLSEETQYQHLYALCSAYQEDGYTFLLNHHFFLSQTWNTCVFVPGVTDAQRMLSTTRLAPL